MIQPLCSFDIGSRTIGPGQPVFIIAEAGVNHNGSVESACELARAAKEAGADCVKFQTFRASRIVLDDAPKARYQLGTTDPAESQKAMLEKLELDADAHRAVFDTCRDLGITCISTPYSPEDIDLLEDLGVAAYKLASISLTEPQMIRQVARTGKPVILSTGMATLSEVDEAVRLMRECGNEAFAVLQCTTNYPSRIEDANLLAMRTIADALGIIAGYSDHTETPTACITSVALGARLIEKHFTLDKTQPGPDHACSADPAEFALLVRSIREAEASLGSGIKEPCPIELENAKGMRRSLVATRTIEKGRPIPAEALCSKRPASGIAPKHFDEIVGRMALETIPEGSLLRWETIGEKAP